MSSGSESVGFAGGCLILVGAIGLLIAWAWPYALAAAVLFIAIAVVKRAAK